MRICKNAYGLHCLLSDVNSVLNMINKEFHHCEYEIVMSSDGHSVQRVVFRFRSRRSYYCDVFPDKLMFLDSLSYYASYCGSAFTRHEFYKVKDTREYVLTLFYV